MFIVSENIRIMNNKRISTDERMNLIPNTWVRDKSHPALEPKSIHDCKDENRHKTRFLGMSSKLLMLIEALRFDFNVRQH